MTVAVIVRTYARMAHAHACGRITDCDGSKLAGKTNMIKVSASSLPLDKDTPQMSVVQIMVTFNPSKPTPSSTKRALAATTTPSRELCFKGELCFKSGRACSGGAAFTICGSPLL